MDKPLPIIAVLGASGLIGEAIASRLLQAGFSVVPIARRFTRAQKTAFGTVAVESPIVALDAAALAKIFAKSKVDIVVNCIGVLQDRLMESTDAVHRAFVARLVASIGSLAAPILLIHLSAPGKSDDDWTPFSRTKRQAEAAIVDGSAPFVILRPGFVVASAAYGGSALIRAMAALQLDLPARLSQQPFAATDVGDIARTVASIARRWQAGEHHWNAVWDVMEMHPSTVGSVIGAFRKRFGASGWRLVIPLWLLGAGARAGDLASHLGWSPPIRTTALLELRRGVAGDPKPWFTATDIEPASLESTLRQLPVTVQEKWFARLYLAKALILLSLVVFWALSGLIALTVAFNAATAILTSHGFPLGLAHAITVASSLADIAVGLAIAFKRASRAGLVAGIAVSLFYMAGAAVLTPDLWIEPLGALVKTVPAVVLMLVALATLDNR